MLAGRRVGRQAALLMCVVIINGAVLFAFLSRGQSLEKKEAGTVPQSCPYSVAPVRVPDAIPVRPALDPERRETSDLPLLCVVVHFKPESKEMFKIAWIMDVLLPTLPRKLRYISDPRGEKANEWCPEMLVIIWSWETSPIVNWSKKIDRSIVKRLTLYLASDERCQVRFDWAEEDEVIKRVFRNYWCDETKRWPAGKTSWMPIGPSTLFGGSLVEANFVPASERHIPCLFIGEINSDERRDLLKQLTTGSMAKYGCVAQDSGVFGGDGKNAVNGRQMRWMMLDTKVAFVPRGFGWNIETFRLWEALESGAVPVLIQTNQVAASYFFDVYPGWPLPIVRDLREIPPLLDRLLGNPSELDAVQAASIRWWRTVFRDTLKGFQEAFPPRA